MKDDTEFLDLNTGALDNSRRAEDCPEQYPVQQLTFIEKVLFWIVMLCSAALVAAGAVTLVLWAARIIGGES